MEEEGEGGTEEVVDGEGGKKGEEGEGELKE